LRDTVQQHLPCCRAPQIVHQLLRATSCAAGSPPALADVGNFLAGPVEDELDDTKTYCGPKLRKVNSTGTRQATGLPSFIAGLNFHLRTVSIAFSSKPNPGLFNTWMSPALPSRVTTTERTTLPL